MARSDELLAFSGLTGRWVAVPLKLNEQIVEKKTDGNVALVATNLRVLGFSGLLSNWNAEDLDLKEKVTETEVRGNVATVVTDKRALGFSARTGAWVEKSFILGP